MKDEPLYYDQNGRAVYRNEDVPHEEERNLYCPNPCKFKDTCWKNPCIERPELTKIKAIGQLNFKRLDNTELTCEQVEECFDRHSPSYVKIESSMVDDSYVQIVWDDNTCPVQFIREVIGDDLSSIKNIHFENLTSDLIGYFFFECHDLVKAEKIKNEYLSAIDKYFDGKADVVLRTAIHGLSTPGTDDDYMYFYFDLKDLDAYQSVLNFCNELNLEIEFDPINEEVLQ